MGRSELREHIFRMLFRVEFHQEEEMPEQIQLYFDALSKATEEEQRYMEEKYQHIVEKKKEIDDIINTSSKGWKTPRMNKVDLTILRLAVYEMIFDEDIPAKVAINEAIELGKKYSSEEGPSFINGVLGNVLKEV